MSENQEKPNAQDGQGEGALQSTETEMEKLIREAAGSLASGSVDGQSFTNRSLKELMELDRYENSKKAQRKGKIGIRFARVRRGSVHD